MDRFTRRIRSTRESRGLLDLGHKIGTAIPVLRQELRTGCRFVLLTHAESKARLAVYPTAKAGFMELRTSERRLRASGAGFRVFTYNPALQLTSWVSFMIKLLRAYGGCLGARRR